MFGAIARGVTKRPWFVIVGWVLAAAAVMVFSPKLSEVTVSDQAAFLPATAESRQAAELAANAFPDTSGASAVVIVKRDDGKGLTPADADAVASLSTSLNAARIAGVRGVEFDPLLQVATNRSVAIVGVSFVGAAEDESVQDAVAALRERVKTQLPDHLDAGMTGEAAIVVDNADAFAHAESIVTIATVVLIVALLLLMFRSPIAAALPLVSVGLVYGIATSLSAAVLKVFGWHVGQELATLLVVVLFGIGTDYILFLLFRYRERLRAGDDPRTAIVTAVERIGEAIMSAAFAVIAAFGALVLATLSFFTAMGPTLAISVFVMLLAALTLVPAVVVVLGRRVFWPSRKVRQGRAFQALGRSVAKRPLVTTLAILAVLAGLGVGTIWFKPTYDPIAQLPPGTEATRAFEDLKLGFPAGALQSTDVYLQASRRLTQDDIGAFTARLAGIEGVAMPLPGRVSADGRTAVVPVMLVADPNSPEALELVSGPLRERAHAAALPNTTVLVGGQTMVMADISETTNRDLRLIFPVAGGLFLLILIAMLRAALAPVYLVALVVGGYVATLGAAAAVFRDGLGFMLPLVLYLFVTAIGTDYNILITARLREEIRDGRTPREAAALAIAQAGPSVGSAALILAGTFGALMVSGVPFFTQIGFAVTFGIFVVAFLIAMLLVPAITALVGRPAWWPARLDKRRAPDPRDLGIEEPSSEPSLDSTALR